MSIEPSESDSPISLGRLKLVDPRQVWPDEATDFTPWLLDNEDYLGEVLGIDVVLEERERPVGAYSVDLFGSDETHQCPLIVENQLEVTDNQHLGQLLTYAAGTDSKTIIWVSPEFRDEHRKALDFLNSISDDETRFFGVEVAVGRIGDSALAPIFRVMCEPDNWRYLIQQGPKPTDLTSSQAAYYSFWTTFLKSLHAKHPGKTKVQSPGSLSHIRLKYMRRGILIRGGFFAKGKFACQIYIDTVDEDANKAIFDALSLHKDTIETELATQTRWYEMLGRRACRISVSRDGTIKDTQTHDELISWLTLKYLDFVRVFVPLVQELDADLWESEAEEA